MQLKWLRPRRTGYTIGSFVVGVPVLGHQIGIPELTPEQFDPLGIFLTYPFVIAAAGDAPYGSLEELAEHAKSNGVALGHFGAPLIPTKVTLAYAKGAGFEWGSDAAFDMLDCNSLASGDADVINTTLQLILPCLDNVKVLASVTGERISLTPDAPTVGEVNPDLALALWNGLFVHKDTPQDRSRQDHRRGEADRDERAGTGACRRNRGRRLLAGRGFRRSPDRRRHRSARPHQRIPGIVRGQMHSTGGCNAARAVRSWGSQPVESRDGQARAGALAFQLTFLLFALFLLSQIGAETKSAAGGNFAAQPRLWPAIGVGGMLLFGLAQIPATWHSRVPGEFPEILNWARAIEYLIWFMAYVAAVPVVGYLPSTVVFTVLLAVRQGYRSAAVLVSAAVLGAAVVTVFKAGLSVRIPGGAVYEHLPAGLRSFMILNF